MPDTALEETKLKEYRQRRRLESLRQQLYAKPDPVQATEVSTALTEAESKLGEVPSERRLPEKSANAERSNAGVLFSTANGVAEKAGGIMLGADTTGMDTKVLLRMARVPTGVVPLLDVKETPLVSFEISNKKDEPLRVRLTSYVEGFSASAVDTVELEAGKDVNHRSTANFLPSARSLIALRCAQLSGRWEEFWETRAAS